MSEEAQRAAAAALRTITHARILCTNSIHELEVIDNLTDDWNMNNARASKDSLEIHLQAEISAKEASTILENLTALMTTRTVLEDWLYMELEVRRENAVLAAKEIVRVLDGLEDCISRYDELGVVEMKRRAEIILAKLDVALKEKLEQLVRDWKAAVEASIKAKANDGGALG